MSHTVTIKTQLKDEAAIAAACKELGIAAPVRGKASLYDTATEHEGVIIKLKGWHYPVIIDTKTGGIQYDNYNGEWGAQAELDRFTQLYAVHKATADAQRRGFLVRRVVGKNDNIHLEVTGL